MKAQIIVSALLVVGLGGLVGGTMVASAAGPVVGVPAQEVAIPTFFSAYSLDANAAAPALVWQYDQDSDAYTWLQNPVEAPAPVFQYNPDSDAVTWPLTPAQTSDQVLMPTLSAAPAISLDNGSSNSSDPMFLGDNGD